MITPYTDQMNDIFPKEFLPQKRHLNQKDSVWYAAKPQYKQATCYNNKHIVNNNSTGFRYCDG